MSAVGPCGVRIAGFGSSVPPRVLANADLEQIMNTSDEWITQRTGVRERRIVDPRTEGAFTLSRDALKNALADAGMGGQALDLIIVATCTSEMSVPSIACRVAAALDAVPAAAFDLTAACSGFVYALNVADSLVRSGRHRTVGVVGCDTMSTVTDFSERTVSILFGDAAGAAVLVRDENPSLGCVYQSMGADGSGWETLYLPKRCQDVPESDRDNRIRMGCLRMNGREVFKFAVNKFRETIEDALAKANLRPDQVSQFVCHQSNVRIINAAKERLGLRDDQVYVNIDRYGNSSAGSVPLCLDECWRLGRIRRGDHVVLVAFGAGLTWASSVWKL
jgi:3-oxoacyl-[acyl-carrier-protein] synthase III